MTKAAFAYWNGRIAPVFDTARQVHIAVVESGTVVREGIKPLADGLPLQKVQALAELGVTALVCGAISRPLQEMVAARGIRVFPFVAGDLHEVVEAWLGDRLGGDAFAMPGCCGRARNRRQMLCGRNKEGYAMNGQGRGGTGRGPGQGQGKGQGGPGRGRMDGPLAAGPEGACLCPKCGHREPHERGVPCAQKQCPKCGSAMTRE